MPRVFRLLVAGVVAAIAIAACGGSSTPSAKSSTATTQPTSTSTAPAGSTKVSASVTLETAKVGSLGTVLVNSSGHVLYVFAPDNGKKVTCNADCQSIWPAEVSPTDAVAKATGQVKQSLIGSLPDPATGGRIVTYDGWPLYTYVADNAPDQASGQNIDLNGGYWWAISPSGKIIK